jgi:uncharacterized membrane protein
VCLGEGSVILALGALLLFLSNLVALVLAGTILFAALGYSAEADRAARLVGAQRRTRVTLTALLLAVLLPLGANTALVLLLHQWSDEIETVSETWLAAVPSAEVTSVDFASSTFTVHVRTPGDLPPPTALLEDLSATLPAGLTVVVDTTYGDEVEVGTTGAS